MEEFVDLQMYTTGIFIYTVKSRTHSTKSVLIVSQQFRIINAVKIYLSTDKSSCEKLLCIYMLQA